MIYSINIVETGDVFCPFHNQWRVMQIQTRFIVIGRGAMHGGMGVVGCEMDV